MIYCTIESISLWATWLHFWEAWKTFRFPYAHIFSRVYETRNLSKGAMHTAGRCDCRLSPNTTSTTTSASFGGDFGGEPASAPWTEARSESAKAGYTRGAIIFSLLGFFFLSKWQWLIPITHLATNFFVSLLHRVRGVMSHVTLSSTCYQKASSTLQPVLYLHGLPNLLCSCYTPDRSSRHSFSVETQSFILLGFKPSSIPKPPPVKV